MATISLGSDTGGSIREPAAFCNVVGFKPTYGRVSRYGLIAFASSLDQIGPFARTVEDAALTYDAIGGHDPHDATSVEPAARNDRRRICARSARRCAWASSSEFATADLGADVDAAYQRPTPIWRSSGPNSSRSNCRPRNTALATYYLIAPAECSSNLARFDGVRYGLRVDGADVGEMYERTRAQGFGAEVKRRILIGTYALVERLLRRLLRQGAEGAHA